LIAFTLELHEKEVLTVLEVQVIMGLWMPALQCRRACMSCFHEIWKQLHRSRNRHVRLNGKAKDELLLAIALAPLMVTKLGSPCSAVITCSDASLEGGGVCSASALSNKGSLALAQLRSQPFMNGLDKIVLVEVFSGIGGGRRAFDLAALHVACYVALDTSRSAAAVIESCWPDAHQFDHVKGSASQVASCIRMHACRATHVLVIFGATHRISSGETAKEAVDGLTIEGLKLAQSLHSSLPHLKVSCLGESEMDLAVRSPRCKTELEQFLTTNPVYACAERTSGMYRPRLYWTSWQVSSYANAPLQFNKTVGHMELLFKEDRRAAHDLEREGLRRGDGNPLTGLASAARCQPRKRPSSRPSDLSQYSAADLKRYAAGKYAYPLDHYCLNNMVQESTKAPRPLNSAEREWFLGFPIAHTEKCWSRHMRDTQKAAWEAERCTLLGTALACPIIAYLVSDWAYQNQLASTAPCMKSVLDRTGPMLMQGVYDRNARRKTVTQFEMKEVQEFTAEAFRRCSHRGTELRLGTRPSGRPDAWPIGRVPAGLLVWDVDLAFKLKPAIITVQELRAVLSAMKWRARQSKQAGSRFLHLVDSQVSLLALAKGRSSSSALTYILQRISAVQLASNLSPLYGYVSTSDNPADGPSRWLNKAWHHGG
jgi:hypothetical protein